MKQRDHRLMEERQCQLRRNYDELCKEYPEVKVILWGFRHYKELYLSGELADFEKSLYVPLIENWQHDC